MLILAVESSCDETAVAIYNENKNRVYDVILSQANDHAQYGGVVPELAARSHQEAIALICQQACEKANVSLSEIDYFAYTKGPGLVGPLLIGCAFVQALAAVYNKPVIPINHLEAHLCIAKYEFSDLDFPFLALLVSGGHTAIILAKSLGQYEVLGKTLDDAAGEAFDKGAKTLGLGYPGGPLIASEAQNFKGSAETAPQLPIPMQGKNSLDFSFSGLKTAFKQAVQRHGGQHKVPAFAWALQNSIVTSLTNKLAQAVKDYPDIPIVIAGGVAANTLLRQQVTSLARQYNVPVYYPSTQYCTDNGAMIAYMAALRVKSNIIPAQGVTEVDVRARWPLSQL